MITAQLPAIADINLLRGAHRDREAGVCLMEAVAWFAGEAHSDSPQCTDVALAAYGRSLNDRMKDDERHLLRPLIPRLVGTRGTPELAKRRARLLVDRYLRVDLPAMFRELPNKPREDLAIKFESLTPVVDAKSAAQARDMAREIRDGLWRDLTPAQRSAYADAYADAADLKALRASSIARAIASFEAAIALTETA
jgi:hypothetical protein